MGETKQKTEKKQVPIIPGVFTMPTSSDKEPALIGTRCRACNEVFFRPIREGGCPNCYEINSMDEISLSRVGTIDSYTIVHQAVPGWEGPVPYGVVIVKLPEKVFVEAALTECDLNEIQVGIEAEVAIEKVCTDKERNEVLGYKFRPLIAKS